MTEDAAVTDGEGRLRCAGCNKPVVIAIFEMKTVAFVFNQTAPNRWTPEPEPLEIKDDGVALYICRNCSRVMGEVPAETIRALATGNPA